MQFEPGGLRLHASLTKKDVGEVRDMHRFDTLLGFIKVKVKSICDLRNGKNSLVRRAVNTLQIK